MQKCRKFVLRALALCAGVFLLSACHSPPPAPISQRPPPPSEKIDYHLVSQGETLFAIAWRYEKDVDKLARANGLRPPYTIYRGQRLTLDTTRIPPPRYTSVAPKPAPVSSSKTSTKTKVVEVPPKTPVKVTRPPPKSTASLPSNWNWQWPTEGRVTKTYNSDPLFKGIDIQSLPGQAVMAAAPGIVVYSGEGLRGYGRLVIVKHSEVYLSAYAHCRTLLVQEGQVLKTGQKIAEVGGDPANNKRLYFEIRKDGKPVNPLAYLPKR
ncbi:peptidoglycan DD-metalloendopeptidase family protein [Porticoccus litoralis]|uniref:Peptidoglycan DD-metalloendopeptidase family protein n=1 Tax=Porticoccus litoralis TaxID=434086 RepID=A0AAW8B0I6_9GAMM|nr:peptidoglycan DD-metalloendopeptidase family protein [Porticoccus litoralis]MDP1519473.1 peptidoglycan DD-metalloendopeptidase family protein [Porticoccus litoralis]